MNANTLKTVLFRTALVAMGLAYGGQAYAGKVYVVQAGNDIPSGGWCDASNQNLAQGATRSYRLDGSVEYGQSNGLSGKYRMKTHTDKFEFAGTGASGADSPAVTFNSGSATPNTFQIKAKSGAATGTHTIEFVAVDSTGAESERKSCKITVTTGGAAHYDLKIDVSAVKEDHSDRALSSTGEPAGTAMTFKVVVTNVATNITDSTGAITSTAVAGPTGFNIGLNRYDHTGSTYQASVTNESGSGTTQSLPTIGLGSTNAKTYYFKENSRSAGSYFYKGGISPYFTDKNNSNNNNNQTGRFVKFVASTATTVKFTDYLSGKFVNEKCANCHSFTDRNSPKRSIHVDRGIPLDATEATLTNAATCANSNCHGDNNPNGFPNGSNWRAPPVSMRWYATTSASSICSTIKTQSTATAMKDHLKMDSNPDLLIKWALGKMNVSDSEWNGKVDAWADGGMNCN